MVDMEAPLVRLAKGALRRVGGAVALDFVNTVDWHLGQEPDDWLLSYGDLLAWARAAAGIDAGRARRLAGLAKADPAAAGRVLTQARHLRESLFRVFLALVREAIPDEADLRAVNAWLIHAAPRDGLRIAGRRLAWRWPEPETLESVLAPVLWSAGDILTGESRGRLKLCAAEDCGWVFLDASRKANRVWCSMESCGNRAKARRHYQRRRAVG